MIHEIEGIFNMMSKPSFSLLLLGAALVPLSSAHAQSGTNAVNGQYAFYLSGQEKLPSGGSELEVIAGSFHADGQGHITSGVLDKNSGTGLVQVSKLSGVYNVDSTTGKGTVTLQLPTGPLSFVFYTQPPLQTPVNNYAPIRAAIVAAGGPLQSGTGRLADTFGGYYPETAIFSLSGENTPGASAISGIASLNITGSAEQVTGQAELIENGSASFYPGITGTASGVDATGRFTVTLTGMGSHAAAHYAVYQGAFSNGDKVFLSLDPHGTAPLLLGTNGGSLPSYVIQYYGSYNF